MTANEKEIYGVYTHLTKKNKLFYAFYNFRFFFSVQRHTFVDRERGAINTMWQRRL